MKENKPQLDFSLGFSSEEYQVAIIFFGIYI